jgi:hypothetical protein
MESGDSFLFDQQVISITSQGREHSYALIIEAIQRAVKVAFTRKQTAPKLPATTEVAQSNLGDVHEPDGDSQTELMAALRLKFETAEAAFASFSNEKGIISKKEWRYIIKKLLPKANAKKMRKQLPKKVSLVQFCEMAGELKDKEVSESEIRPLPSSHLADLPSEVPILPTSFKSRPHAQEQLVAALLDSSGNRSTAVTAPKSRVSSQGMGGVGKTMLTAACVRDERVRAAFHKIVWISFSQKPNLSHLLARAYTQLTNSEMKALGSQSIENGAQQLAMAALGVDVLLTLDDVAYSFYFNYLLTILILVNVSRSGIDITSCHLTFLILIPRPSC